MLDINKIRENKEKIAKALLKRMKAADLNLDELLALDDKRRKIITESEKLKAEKNKYSKKKPDKKIISEMKKVGERVKKLELELKNIEVKLNEKLSQLPNIPADDVPAGGKENNQVMRFYGEKPEFKFKEKDHIHLAKSLNLIDYERAVKMSGTNFWIYKGDGAILEWALLNYFIEFHKKNKYEFLLPPYLLNAESAYASGHLPKFRDDLFWTEDGLCLDATSEMMIGNFHRDEILAEQDLPKKYFAYSACFRREAGAYRTEERGILRGHQFNKIEMFMLTKPENSWKAFEELVHNAEELVKGLGLHAKTVLLAAGDASDAMSKTVDIEVWIPSIKMYKEVSSVSNALDYQARRGNIRFKNTITKKNEYVHTLNASGLATSRLLAAILEQHQKKDGSVEVPKVLRGFLGKKVIKGIK